ncbi:MAG TPA: 50S ribosomal protein L25 [Candidatus Limiplasma sp.]|nr:50S ribosomal protein L25 [Candidatus Limiplasma sp.]
MDKSTKLLITKRTKGSKGAMHALRREGLLPGSISQKGHDAVSFSVNKIEFRKAFAANGTSGIYTLQADKKTVFTAMIREIQYVPGSEDFLHVTFQAVSLTEETTADIPLHIVGREELQHNGYELLQQLESVHLKGLPGDFPTAVEVDVSAMVPGDQLTVGELKLPSGVTSLTEEERMVVSVAHPKAAEEPADEEEAAGADAAPTADEA